ncbi:MAG TPA: AraC family transcriptional regulator [Dokdonella sp.]
MHAVNLQVAHGGSLELTEKSLANAGAAALAVVVGGGRGGVLRVEAPLAGLWMPLRGRLQFGLSTDSVLHTGELRVAEAEPRVHAVGRGNALWIAVLGTGAAWRGALGALLEIPTPEPLLLPARHAADRALRRSGVALARAAADGSSAAAVEVVIDRVLALQQPFEDAIARCPGRTYAQRRQVFVRLQRVRNYLAANCHLDIDNEALARMASYSPWHFIRAFRAAYQETPHAYLVRQRLERARRLLRASPLAIAEVALASGFENRCAFSRLFRQHFGTTAGAVRRGAAAPSLPVQARTSNAQSRQRGSPI